MTEVARRKGPYAQKLFKKDVASNKHVSVLLKEFNKLHPEYQQYPAFVNVEYVEKEIS